MKMLRAVELGIFLIIATMAPSKCEIKAQCDPALENNPHNLTFSWKTNNTNVSVNVESHDSTIGFCEMSTARCISILPGLAKIYLTNISDMYHLTVIIKNISRDPDFTSEGYWTLKYNMPLTVFLSCTLKVLSMPRKVICESYWINGAVELNCSTQMIYPEAKCQFFSNDIELNKFISKLHVSYKHSILNGGTIYYRSSCAVFLSLSSFRNETYKVSVTMYPNGSDTDLNFGTTITSEIELGRVILRDCPPVIEVGTSVTCICEKSNFNLKNDLIVWLDENQQLIVPISNVLHFNVSQNSITYICVVKNMTGSIIDKVLYRPNIIVRPHNLSCQKIHLEDDIVMISCSALGFYPDPKCKFIVYGKTGEIKLQNETAASQNELQLGQSFEYQCALNISKSVMQQDLHVVVIMYPYITGLETEVFIFGSNATNLLDRCEPVCLNEKHIKLVFIFIGTISPIVLVTLVVVFVLYKKGVTSKVWKRIQGKANGDQREERASNGNKMNQMTENSPLNESNEDNETVM